MKIKNSIINTTLLLVFCFSLCISAQTSDRAYNDIQPNIVLAATVGASDFKPFETRMLSKGTWIVKAIKPEGIPENRLAWSSWDVIDSNWTGADCNGKNRGWTTVFYISSVEVETNRNKTFPQFTSRRCRTQALAIEDAANKSHTFKLDGNSAVTFFLGAFYDVPKRPLGGGLVLSLTKLRQQQQQQQRQTRSKKR